MEPERPTDPRAKAREAAAPRVFALLIGALLLIFAAALLRAAPDPAQTSLLPAPGKHPASFRADAPLAPSRPPPHRA